MIASGHHLSEAEIAQAYDDISHEIVMPAYFYPEVVQFVGEIAGQRVLDCGCGNGALLHLLAARQPAELYGLEISPALCALAKSRLAGRARIYRGSLQATWPFPDGRLDLVVMTEVIEHLANPGRALAEARRVVAPSGRMVITFPNATAYEPFLAAAHRRNGQGRWWAFLPWEHPRKTRQPIDTVYGYEEIRRILAESRLVVTRIHGREALPYLWDWASIERCRPLRAAVRSLERMRPLADRLLNQLQRPRWCYRLFVECRPGRLEGPAGPELR